MQTCCLERFDEMDETNVFASREKLHAEIADEDITAINQF